MSKTKKKKATLEGEVIPPRGPGRPKGSQNFRTLVARELVDHVLAEGKSPLEVMLHCMRTAFDANKFEDAAHYASMAAPYVHPRLSQIDVSSNPDSANSAAHQGFLTFAATLNKISEEMVRNKTDATKMKLVSSE